PARAAAPGARGHAPRDAGAAALAAGTLSDRYLLARVPRPPLFARARTARPVICSRAYRAPRYLLARVPRAPLFARARTARPVICSRAYRALRRRAATAPGWAAPGTGRVATLQLSAATFPRSPARAA